MNIPQRSATLIADIDLRIEKLQQLMAKAGMPAMLVSGNTNILYLSGLIFRGYIYLPAEGRPIWFVMRPTWEGDGIISLRKPEQIPTLLSDAGVKLPEEVGLEHATLSHSEYVRLSKALAVQSTPDASSILATARMVKTPYEQQLMREDGLHHIAVYEQIPHLYRKGMSDVELQIEIERLLRQEGCLGMPRLAGNQMEINLGSILAGENADAPSPYDFLLGGAGTCNALPIGANGTIIRSGMAVMIDVNGNFNGYQTDLTRVYALSAELPATALKAHQTAIAILRRLEKESLPGTPLCNMYNTAAAMVADAGLTDYFQGHTQQAAFLGHGVGLELNEQPPISPRSKVMLQQGMALAVEPKFVIPGVGAVGLENTYLVTASGLENITPMREDIIPLQGI